MGIDPQTGHDILTGLLGVTSAYYARAKYKLDQRIGSDKVELQRAKSRIQFLEEYLASRKIIRHLYVDAVIIGPRASGKTSLASLWTNALTDVVGQTASYQWELHQGDICEFPEEEKNDSSIGLTLKYIPTARLRVRDYPGEEKFRKEALDHIGELEDKVVLILALFVEYADGKFHETRKNTTYYNSQFIHAINHCLSKSDRKIAKVFVVINKADMLPATWDDDTIISHVKAENVSAIENIEQCFGEGVQYRVASAQTNRNVLNLLGEISTAVLTKPEQQRTIVTWLNKHTQIVDSPN